MNELTTLKALIGAADRAATDESDEPRELEAVAPLMRPTIARLDYLIALIEFALPEQPITVLTRE